MTNLIINLAPTGNTPTKEKTPWVPLTPEAIIKDTLECAPLGVSMVHLHARDDEGRHASDQATWTRILSGIREKRPELILVASTSGRFFPDPEARTSVLYLPREVRPDMASLTLGTLPFRDGVNVNNLDLIIRLLECMEAQGIKPELEIFDLGMIHLAHYLIDKGHLRPPFYFNLILGHLFGSQPTLRHLGVLLPELPDDSCCCLGGIGFHQLTMNSTGILFADGVRVGLEDSLWWDENKKERADNYRLVERIVHLAALRGRGIASTADVRRRLQLAAVRPR